MAPVERSALVIIDMMNTFDFPGGTQLAEAAGSAAARIAALRRRYQQAGAPVIYVNDNFTNWKAGFEELIAICSQPSALGADIARQLRPDRDDYYVLKPKHSAFHATPLTLLLSQLETTHLVLTGIAADACVLTSAYDAKMHGYQLHIPLDCVAAITDARCELALRIMNASLRAAIDASQHIQL